MHELKKLLPYPSYSVSLYSLVLIGIQVSQISLGLYTYSCSLSPSTLLILATEINLHNVMVMGSAFIRGTVHPKSKAPFAYK